MLCRIRIAEQYQSTTSSNVFIHKVSVDLDLDPTLATSKLSARTLRSSQVVYLCSVLPCHFRQTVPLCFKESLVDLKKNLKDLQSDLLLRSGRAEEVGITGDLGG